jgi:hypothetical protein
MSAGRRRSWKRDQINIDEMLDFIDQRDEKRPFMTYMFFESTHANYDFPARVGDRQALSRRPQLSDGRLSQQIGEIKNRYINAAHHVDSPDRPRHRHLRRRSCSTTPSSSSSATTARNSWSAAAGDIAPSSTASRPARRR